MKTVSSILAVVALLAVAALGANGVHVGDNPISNRAHETNHLVTADPVVDERTWVPFRALRSMDSPKQGPHDDGKHLSHDPMKGSKHNSPHRALGPAHVTPAPTTTTTKATPAPTKMTKPEATPAATTTTTKETPCHTPTSSTHKVALPPANKKPTAPATKHGKSGTSTTSNAVQRETRNLGGGEAKQQLPPNDHHSGAKQGVKNGVKHQ